MAECNKYLKIKTMKLIISKSIMLILLCLTNTTYSQNKTPDSFQDIKLGTTLTTFMSKYPDASNCSFIVGLQSGLFLNGIKMYGVGTKTNSSGDQVNICVGFYKQKLVLIDVGYFEYIEKKDLLSGLKAKFGKYTNVKTNYWKDYTNGKIRINDNYYWNNFPSNLLVFNYNNELGIGHIIYVDKKTQSALRKQRLNRID